MAFEACSTKQPKLMQHSKAVRWHLKQEITRPTTHHPFASDKNRTNFTTRIVLLWWSSATFHEWRFRFYTICCYLELPVALENTIYNVCSDVNRSRIGVNYYLLQVCEHLHALQVCEHLQRGFLSSELHLHVLQRFSIGMRCCKINISLPSHK